MNVVLFILGFFVVVPNFAMEPGQTPVCITKRLGFRGTGFEPKKLVLAQNTNGTVILFTADYGKLSAYDVESGQKLYSVAHPSSGVRPYSTDFVVSKDLLLAVMASYDGSTVIADVYNKKSERRKIFEKSGPVSTSISNDGSRAFFCNGTEIKTIKKDDTRALETLSGLPAGHIDSIGILGNYLYSFCDDGTITLYDLVSQQVKHSTKTDGKTFVKPALLDNGSVVYASFGTEGRDQLPSYGCFLFDPASQSSTKIATLSHQPLKIVSVDGGNQVAIFDGNREITLWDLKNADAPVKRAQLQTNTPFIGKVEVATICPEGMNCMVAVLNNGHCQEIDL